MLTTFTLFVLLAGVVLWNLMIIVPMRQACVLERFGNFRRVLEPGFHIVVPFLDKVAYRHEIREQVFDIPAQLCITRDNIQVAVDGVVYLKVMDAKRASYGIGDYQLASINLAQTTMRSEIGKLTLSDTFYERDKLNDSIVREIDEASDPWGIKVMRYEIKNISPSDQVVHTLEKQMEAEREKRADITLAMAQKESKILISEGHRQEAINISEGEKQKRINEAQGRASEIKILAEASAEGLQQVAHAIKQPGGDMAVKMRLVEDFIGRVGEVMK
ncbi:MAG: SPFH domain-containing protein, partial [Methylococcales bacterium]|nr:SPFH domain-containing protein [Methylococcales bacterium]